MAAATRAGVLPEVMRDLLEKSARGTLSLADMTVVSGVPPALLPKELGGFEMSLESPSFQRSAQERAASGVVVLAANSNGQLGPEPAGLSIAQNWNVSALNNPYAAGIGGVPSGVGLGSRAQSELSAIRSGLYLQVAGHSGVVRTVEIYPYYPTLGRRTTGTFWETYVTLVIPLDIPEDGGPPCERVDVRQDICKYLSFPPDNKVYHISNRSETISFDEIVRAADEMEGLLQRGELRPKTQGSAWGGGIWSNPSTGEVALVFTDAPGPSFDLGWNASDQVLDAASDEAKKKAQDQVPKAFILWQCFTTTVLDPCRNNREIAKFQWWIMSPVIYEMQPDGKMKRNKGKSDSKTGIGPCPVDPLCGR